MKDVSVELESLESSEAPARDVGRAGRDRAKYLAHDRAVEDMMMMNSAFIYRNKQARAKTRRAPVPTSMTGRAF